MEGFVSFLSGALVLIGTIVAWIIGYKRIRDDWLHSLLVFTTGLTIIMTSANPWATITGALPWELYATGVSVPLGSAVIYAVFAIIAFTLYIETLWWLACLLRLIARHVPTPKQP